MCLLLGRQGFDPEPQALKVHETLNPKRETFSLHGQPTLAHGFSEKPVQGLGLRVLPVE